MPMTAMITPASMTAPLTIDRVAATPSTRTGTDITWPVMISSVDFGRGSGRRLSPKRASRAPASSTSSPAAIDVSRRRTTPSAVSVCQPSARGRAGSCGMGPDAAASATTASRRRRSSAGASKMIRTLPVRVLA